MNQNYQKILEKTIESHRSDGSCPRLLLHSCCAPCSTYVLEYLSRYFAITLFYYNPNLFPDEEYRKRVREQKELLEKFGEYDIDYLEGDYDFERFYELAKGVEQEPEGGKRCFRCYELRLRETAIQANARGFDYFTTTLTISPLKNSQKLNEIGQALAKEYDVSYLSSDFKKKGGYQRSIELSKNYGLYRQAYCGCMFSQNMTHKRGIS